MEAQQEAAAPVAEAAPPIQEAPAPEAKLTPAELVETLDAQIDIETLASTNVEDPVFKTDENYKVKYDEVISTLPEDAKKLVANLRSSYTKKTQEYAELRKKTTQERDAVEAQRKALFDSESFQKLDEASNQLRAFKAEHPDLTTHKAEIYKLMTSNQHVSLEDAYWQVKGHSLAAQEKETSQELSRYKQAAKSAGLKVGGASRGSSNGIPKYVLDQDDPVAIYNWLKENKSK